MVRLAVDAMGGDDAPGVVVAGAILAKQRLPDLDLTLVGAEDTVRQELVDQGGDPGLFEILHASEIVGMHESPVEALRKKPDSSLRKTIAGYMARTRAEKRNALSRALREELVHCLDELEKSDGVRVAILTGAGPACCAGFDRSEFEGGQMAQVFADAVAYHRHVYTFAKPLYFAVDQLMPALEDRQGLDALIVTMETYVDAVATSGTLGRAYYELRRIFELAFSRN